MHMAQCPAPRKQESLRIGQRVAQRIGSIRGVRSVAQWVGRAESGADTFGTHYSEFEVEIGQLPGADQGRIYREMREALGELGPTKPAAAVAGRVSDQKNEDDDDERPAQVSSAAPPAASSDGQGFLGANFAINTFLTERIGETITGYAAPFVVNVFGIDLDLLDRDVRQVAGVLSEVRGAQEVQITGAAWCAATQHPLAPRKTRLLGLAPLDVLDAVRTAYEGMPVGQCSVANQVIDMVVMLDPASAPDHECRRGAAAHAQRQTGQAGRRSGHRRPAGATRYCMPADAASRP